MKQLAKKNTSYFLKKEEVVNTKKWFLLDAEGKTLGRFASEVAKIIRGKHKTTYTPNVDSGDGVIILNAEKIAVTGNKEAQKEYKRYTGYVGGLRATPYRVMKERKPEEIIRHAVKGMMPKTKLGKAQLKKLRIYAGTSHNMSAQTPIAVEI
ncbi:50S ribosomal protein L13 [Candidatus Aerophobetes bacterium]|uniref:Large ribosomal subunit protein uL13 n=1 Tax=Aerophobetes bacterium TaxID=2030807 RepID=A0A2A4YJR3_UNCAE|nr:MAG: 50S ribosomal protein L13 [Candidatus Aerophobetes bacterium]